MTRLKRYSFAFLVAVALITSCSTSPRAVPESPTLTPLPPPTLALTETMAPQDISSIPGFKDWSVLNAPAVDVAAQDNALILTLKHRALWFMNQRGVLASTLVDGDFRITADVYTAKSSDLSQPPGGDGTVQLGGIMARNGNGARENYVFIVVGDDGDGLSIETKNTTDNVSEYDGPAWGTSNAQLRMCRVGSTFTLYKRHVGTEEAWIQAASFDRPDLPARLQVGVNIYSDSTPDLQVRYENLEIEKLTSTNECETD